MSTLKQILKSWKSEEDESKDDPESYIDFSGLSLEMNKGWPYPEIELPVFVTFSHVDVLKELATTHSFELHDLTETDDPCHIFLMDMPLSKLQVLAQLDAENFCYQLPNCLIPC